MREMEGEQGLRQLIQALPTKEDIQALLSNLLGPLKEEIGEVCSKIEVINCKLHSCEISQEMTVARLNDLEKKCKTQHQRLVTLQLQFEETENRSRRNNLRIKGIPENVAVTELRQTATDIFNKLLDNPPETQIELDRVHRIPTYRNPAQRNPRDVLCRIHFYKIKEEIMRATWRKNPVEIDKQEVQVFSDLCRQTKERRWMLKPLLDHLRSRGATYRWGHPISLIIKKGDHIFNLKIPEQLPELFQFLGSEAFEVPNWIDPSLAGEKGIFEKRDQQRKDAS